MTQIFTGEGLGLSGSSLGLGGYGPKGVARLGQGGCSVYVNASTGNLVVKQGDGFLADVGFGLDLYETYNSRGEGGNSLWRFSVQSRLVFDGGANQAGSQVIRVGEDGHRTVFQWDVVRGRYQAEGGGRSSLSCGPGGWVYHEGEDKANFYYDALGQLQAIRDRDGHGFTLTYDQGELIRISDEGGRQKIQWFFSGGLLREVTTTSDQEVVHRLRYDYDERGRLCKMSRDLGGGQSFWVSYAYEGDSHRLSELRQSDGTSLQIEYDEEGRVRRLRDGEGRLTRYEYTPGQTTVVNDLAEAWTYYYDAKNRLTGVDGPEGYRIRYGYNGDYLSSVAQGSRVWRLSYSEAGDCFLVEEPGGQLIKRTFNAFHQMVSETRSARFDGSHPVGSSETTYFVYDEKGHLCFVIGADKSVTERRYDALGQVLSLRVWQVACSVEASSSTFEALSAWVSSQDAAQVSLVDYVYDWRGQLIQERRYQKVNACGEGVLDGALTTYRAYDAAGRLIEQSTPTETGLHTLHYLYDDLGRLLQTVDNAKQTQRIEYDDMHQRVIQTDANGLQTLRWYDKSGLLLAVIKLDAVQAYGSTCYQYDAAGRLVAETGPDGLTSYFFYDAASRLQAKVGVNGLVTAYRYNEEGFLVSTRCYHERVVTIGWREALPTYVSIKPTDSAHDRVSQILYNNAGQVAYRVDAQGAVVSYDYDAKGNVLSVRSYAKRLSDFNPDAPIGVDCLLGLADANDRAIFYYYDSQSRLIAKVDGEGFAVAYRYDRQGHLVATCHYFNSVKSPVSGQWSQDEPVSSAMDVRTYSVYDGRGLKVADIDGEGYLTAYRYHVSGLLQEQHAYSKALAPGYVVNENTRLEAICPAVESHDHVTRYTYDDEGRLHEETHQSGLKITYLYDELGQLVVKARQDTRRAITRQEQFRYDGLGRVIGRLNEQGALLLQQGDLDNEAIERVWQRHGIRLTYDKAGHLVIKTDALGQSTRYFYDESGFLRYTVDADGAVSETRYNSFGELAFTCQYSHHLNTLKTEWTTESIEAMLRSLRQLETDEAVRYDYNTRGERVAEWIGRHGQATFAYDAFGERVLKSERMDEQRDKVTLLAYDRRGLLTEQLEDVGGLNRRTLQHYDAFEQRVALEDGAQHLTRFEWNKRGEQVAVIKSGGQRKRVFYDAFGRVLSETNWSGVIKTTCYYYDDQNNTLTLINSLENREVVTQFNALGDKLTWRDAQGFLTAFHYDAMGRLIRVDSPEHAFKNYRYDEEGHLLWEDNAAGQVIAYAYDAKGHVLKKTLDPEGLALCTTYQYDGVGRQLQVTEADGLVKQWIYDDQGRLIESCLKNSQVLSKTQWRYDDRGFLLAKIECNPGGEDKVTAYEWDALGRKTATIVDPGGLKLTTRYAYDALDNLVRQTDANGHSKHFAYDVNGRCRYQVDAEGGVTEHVYDVNGDEIQTVVYAKPVISLADYSEEGVKTALCLDAKDRYQFRLFNSEGQVLWFYDAMGYVTSYQYDKNGQVIALCRYAKAVSLDDLKAGKRRLPSIVDSRTQYFIYDGLNQKRFEYDESGRVTQWQYDGGGQVTAKTRYMSKMSCSGVTTVANMLSLLKPCPEKDQCTQYAYDAVGRLLAECSAEGHVTSYQYDALGRVLCVTQHAERHVLLDFDALGMPSEGDRTRYFVYDAAGRERYRMNGEGQVVERRYDAVGRVISAVTHARRVSPACYSESLLQTILQDDDSVRQSQYQYDAADRLISEVNAQQGKTEYLYDGEGNVLSKRDALNAVWAYRYDAMNRLIEMISPSIAVRRTQGVEICALVTQNEYDRFGNLVGVVRDAHGLRQTVRHEYDANDKRIQTIYPDVAVSQATLKASGVREERRETLNEKVQYNAFGEVMMTVDKGGNERHFIYSTQGVLRYQVDAEGFVTRWAYDHFGRQIEKVQYAERPRFTTSPDYTLNALDEACQSSTKDRVEYTGYDRDNQVVEVRKSPVRLYNSKTRHYDRTLSPITRMTYNAFGEVIETAVKQNEDEWAKSLAWYNKAGHKTATIDAGGYLTTHTYTTYGELASTTEHALVAIAWDHKGYTRGESSATDRTVLFAYDALGQMTSKTLKQVSYERVAGALRYDTVTNDLITTYEYDALGHLTSMTDAKGQTAYCYYDALGQMTAKVWPKTLAGRAATTYAYDGLGQLVQTRRLAEGAVMADSDHWVPSGFSNRDVLTVQAYDEQGHLMSETDGLGHTTYYSYDANGHVARCFQAITSVDKRTMVVDKRYSYDKEGRLVQTATLKSDGGIKTEDAQYNAFGEVVAKGVNGVYSLRVDYDGLGRIWRSNSEGYYQLFIYDLADHLTQVVTSTNAFRPEQGRYGVDLSGSQFEDALNFNEGSWSLDLQRQDNGYDALGRLVWQSKTFASNTHLNTVYQSQTLDRWGNVLSHRNAKGYETHYEYNALNQVTRQILPVVSVMDEKGVRRDLAPVVTYACDELGQVMAMTDANGHTVSKAYDALGQVTEETDAKGHTRHKRYTLLDQLSEVVDEQGAVTTYTYDAANRLLSVKSAHLWQGYAYDEAGQLISQTNGANESIGYWYDSLGHQVRRSDARGKSTWFSYDDAGHKTQETDANGNTQSWAYDEQGRVKTHKDLGGHVSEYDYNRNGLLLSERSSSGKHLEYWYQGDGALMECTDDTLHETIRYAYDAEGQVIHKEAGRGGDAREGWLREIDEYEYDALGRLSKLRRRTPEDTDSRFPDKDHALLSIDYDYDAVGNIRHTEMIANYSGYHKTPHEDYFLYDENNRMRVNKGQWVEGEIRLTKAQGSELFYDASGHLREAKRYEQGGLQDYQYHYTADHQLEAIEKNGRLLQTRRYDAADRVVEERVFDEYQVVSQITQRAYDKGLLSYERVLSHVGDEVSRNVYAYDDVGNLQALRLTVSAQGNQAGYQLRHDYDYALWGTYEQRTDSASLTVDNHPTTTGQSVRFYDVNGQLKDAIDQQVDGRGQSNTVHYWNSTFEGMKARQDKEGQTSYLMVAGQTLGDLRLDEVHQTEALTVYGGFSPTGSAQKALKAPEQQGLRHASDSKTADFLERTPGDVADGTLPDVPQNSLGTYTVQSGDSLEGIALQVYGDSSLWYVIADANGVIDRQAKGGQSGGLLVGKRLTLPQVTMGQHHTSKTHKVLSAGEKIGNASATTPLPASPPPVPKKNHGLLAKIVVGVIATIAVIAIAGIIGALAGGTLPLFSLGQQVLSGAFFQSTAGTLAAGFSAGFIGSVVSQGVSKGLGLQESMDFKGALIAGLATAVTAGLGKGLSQNSGYQTVMHTLDDSLANPVFSVPSAIQMLEQNAASQGLNVALRKHQSFDWEALGIAGLSAGLLGGGVGQKLQQGLNRLDRTGLLQRELSAYSQAGLEAMTGTHFNAQEVLSETLGASIGSSVVESHEAVADESNQEPFVLHDELYLSETLLTLLHPERTMDLAYQRYLAQQVEVEGQKVSGPRDTQDILADLSFKSDDLSVKDNGRLQRFEGEYDWDHEYGVGRFAHSPAAKASLLGLEWHIRASEGEYNVDYDMLIVKHPGSGYKKSQVVSYSYYNQSPGSPIWGDADRKTQIEAIDALISASIKSGLNVHDTAYVLAIAYVESGFNPYAAAGTTSATGLGQFVVNSGRIYGINESNRWNISKQAEALVGHFLDNKAQVIRKNLSESYIYKFHHDGPNSLQKNSIGLQIANEKIIPKAGDIRHAILKVF